MTYGPVSTDGAAGEEGGPKSSEPHHRDQINELLGRTESNGASLAASASQWPLSQALQGARDGPVGFMDLVTRGQGDKSTSSRMDHDRMLHEAVNQSLLGAPQQRDGARGAGRASQPRAQETLQLGNCEQPPMDWSLKEVVRFTSSAALTVVEEGLQAPTAQVTAGMRSFAGSESSEHDLSLQEQWQRALMTWKFPSERLLAKDVESFERRGVADLILEPRKAAFQEAFCSAFTQLRSGSCAAFYVVAPDGARNPSVVLFRAAGMAGRPQVHALVSRSTQGMRTMMRGEQYRLQFSMPLAEETQGSGGDAEGAGGAREEPMDEEDAAMMRPGEPEGIASAFDGKPRSLLFFEGITEVAGLFDLITNEGAAFWGLAKGDVPSIIAPVAFEAASIGRLQPWYIRAVSSDITMGVNRVEFSGIVAPWNLDRLRACIQDSPLEASSGAFSMRADALDLSGNLNCAPSSAKSKRSSSLGYHGAPSGAADGVSSGGLSGGWCNEEERRRWMEGRDRGEAGQGAVTAASFTVAEGYSVTLKAASALSARGKQIRDGAVIR